MTPVKQLSEALALMSEENLPKNLKKREKLARARNSLADLLGRLTEIERLAKEIWVESASMSKKVDLLTSRICL